MILNILDNPELETDADTPKMYEYTIFVRSDIEPQSGPSLYTGSTRTLLQGLGLIQDEPGVHTSKINHPNWRLANISTSCPETQYNDALNIFITIIEILPITGPNLFDILDKCGISGKIKPELMPLHEFLQTELSSKYCKLRGIVEIVPRSLHTHDFYQYIRRVKTGIKLDYVPIMTGAQFNAMYVRAMTAGYLTKITRSDDNLWPRNRADPVTYAKVRLLFDDMIHNGFQWVEGLNICPDFCPITKFGQGLFFLDEPAWPMWRTYNGKKMSKIADVTIPDDAIVVVNRTSGGTIMHYKANKVIISNIRNIEKLRLIYLTFLDITGKRNPLISPTIHNIERYDCRCLAIFSIIFSLPKFTMHFATCCVGTNVLKKLFGSP